MPEDWRTALAIAAHPDDLENGASSAVAKWTAQGKHVVYLMVSRGEAGIDAMPPWETGPLRVEEEIRAARVVGVETVEFLNHTDGVIEQGLPLRRDLSRAIRRHRPEVILTLNHHPRFPTGNPNMADHRNVGLSVFDAARDAGNRWVFQELLSEGLDPWNGVRFVAVFGSPDPTQRHRRNRLPGARDWIPWTNTRPTWKASVLTPPKAPATASPIWPPRAARPSAANTRNWSSWCRIN